MQRSILAITVVFLLISCNKETSEYSFTSCRFEKNTKIKLLNNQNGVLNYTNSPGSVPVGEYGYYIISEDRLPLQVCNMPSSVKFDENESRSVSFSGKMIVLPETVDAVSTEIELTSLKFPE